MRRYYLCPMIGSGTEESPYRPKIANFSNVNWTAIVSHNPDGTLKLPWAFVIVRAVDHTTILADSQIKALPDISLDLTVGDLSAAVRNAMNNALTNFGIDTSPVKMSTTIRQVLRYLGRKHVADFDENRFDVAD